MVPETGMGGDKAKEGCAVQAVQRSRQNAFQNDLWGWGLRDTHPRGPLDTPSPGVLLLNLLLAEHAPWLRGRVGEWGARPAP